MDYTKSVEFRGDFRKALDYGIRFFTEKGFTITRNEQTLVEVERSGLMEKNKSTIAGVSKATICRVGKELELSATFGSMRKTLRFMALMSIAMGLVFLVVFGILFARQDPRVLLVALAPPALLLVEVPVLAVLMKWRVSRALDKLLDEMVAAGTTP